MLILRWWSQNLLLENRDWIGNALTYESLVGHSATVWLMKAYMATTRLLVVKVAGSRTKVTSSGWRLWPTHISDDWLLNFHILRPRFASIQGINDHQFQHGETGKSSIFDSKSLCCALRTVHLQTRTHAHTHTHGQQHVFFYCFFAQMLTPHTIHVFQHQLCMCIEGYVCMCLGTKNSE